MHKSYVFAGRQWKNTDKLQGPRVHHHWRLSADCWAKPLWIVCSSPSLQWERLLISRTAVYLGNFSHSWEVSWPNSSFTARGLSFTAKSDLNYQALWKTSISLANVVFMVKACKDAIITLAESPGVPLYNSYTIELGAEDNTAIYIKKHSTSGFIVEVCLPAADFFTLLRVFALYIDSHFSLCKFNHL